MCCRKAYRSSGFSPNWGFPRLQTCCLSLAGCPPRLAAGAAAYMHNTAIASVGSEGRWRK